MAEIDPRQHLEQCIEAGKVGRSSCRARSAVDGTPDFGQREFCVGPGGTIASARADGDRARRVPAVIHPGASGPCCCGLLRSSKGSGSKPWWASSTATPRRFWIPQARCTSSLRTWRFWQYRRETSLRSCGAGFADLTADQSASVIQRVTDSFRSWITAFRSHSQASMIVHSLELPVAAQPRNSGQPTGRRADGLHPAN